MNRCPVCWQAVTPKLNRHIRHVVPQHHDTTGRNVCPMSGQPYRLTIERKAS